MNKYAIHVFEDLLNFLISWPKRRHGSFHQSTSDKQIQRIGNTVYGSRMLQTSRRYKSYAVLLISTVSKTLYHKCNANSSADGCIGQAATDPTVITNVIKTRSL